MHLLPSLAAAALLTLTAQARAQTYSVTYTGVVAPGSSIDTNNLFGGGSVLGDTFSLSFTYALQGTNVSGTDEADYFGGTDYANASPVLNDVLTINGSSFSLNSNFLGQVLVATGPKYTPESYSSLYDHSGNSISAGFLDPLWNNIADLTIGQADASAYDTADMFYGDLSFNDEFLELDSLTVNYNGFSVPEPAAFGLMIVGLTIVGVMKRKQVRPPQNS